MALRQYDVTTLSPAASTGANAAKSFLSDKVAETAGSAITPSFVRVTVDDALATAAAGTGTGSMGGRAMIVQALQHVIDYINGQVYPDV